MPDILDKDFEADLDKALGSGVINSVPDFVDERTLPTKGVPRTQPPAKRVRRAEKIAGILDTREYTGGSVSYYQINIEHPTTPKRKPYIAECNDIIEALGMSYAEGEAFKALWRMCASRQGKSKKGYDSVKYDAEKIVFYGHRILDDIVTPKGNKS